MAPLADPRPPGGPSTLQASTDRPHTTYRTLAFLFTDIEGSTRLWERAPQAMRQALARHDEILRESIQAVGGQLVKTTGDGVMAAFGSAGDGVAASLAAQLALRDEPWMETGPLLVRMGLHVGEAAGDGQDYHGQAVNRAARIMAAGHGGQVLLSAPAAALVIDRLPEGASLLDLGEHHLKDMARPERLFQLVHPRLPGAFPPVSAEGARIRSLPAEPSAFIGREDEVAAVVERLGDQGVRLLTLTGPGGIGKTRLAVRAASEVEATYAGGVVFVDLSSARDTSTLLTTIGRELGLADTSEAALMERLTASIGERELLLILDNLEQITAAAPTLGQLLADCPRLTLLATSREALHVRGEHIHPVPSMRVPEPGLPIASIQDILGYEAVRLFMERARAVRPDFVLSDADAPILADICRRLEGLPLAIELATARLRVFSLEALRDRLGSRLRALGGGARDLPQRQQTLRATIDWSYQLLSPREQRLLDVMSRFHGADVEAVEHVTGDLTGWLEGIEPIEGLVSLVDKSLLRRADGDGDEPRFDMLESVREYAAERLATDQALAAEVGAAHASYYAAWANERGRELDGARREPALARLSTELGNLRASWSWCVEHEDLARLEAIRSGLWPLFDARGWYRGLVDLAGDALRVLESLPTDPERATLTVTLRSDQARALTSVHGYTAEVEAAYERLLGSLQTLEGVDVTEVYPVLRGLASLYSFRAEYAKARELGDQIRRLGEQQGDLAIRADGHLFAGTGKAFGRRLEDGLPDLEAGIALFERAPDAVMTLRLRNDPRVAILTALSLLHWWQGRLDRSLERSEQALALADELGHPSTTGYALFHASLLRLRRGEPEVARALAVRVVDYAEEHELHIWKAVGNVVLGASVIELGPSDEGMRWIRDGMEQYRGLHTPPIFWPFLLLLRAVACHRAGRVDEGLTIVGEALAIAPYLPDLYVVHGDLLLASGSAAAAEEAWEAAGEAARAWGALMPGFRAATRLLRSTPSDDAIREARRASLARVHASFSEGLDMPGLVEAAAILEATASPGESSATQR